MSCIYNFNILHYLQEVIKYIEVAMFEAIQNLTFQTPKKSANKKFNNDSTAITKQLSKRQPIFKTDKKVYSNQTENLLGNIFNVYHGSFEEQQVSEYQVFCSDFCGCQDPQQPCIILRDCLLINNKITLHQMREEYNKILQNLDGLSSKKRNGIRRQNLLRNIPKNYPQIFLSQINSLLTVLQRNLTPPEFLCMCWIQYHTKFQYFTYYLFCDLKQGFNSIDRFRQKLNIQLGYHNLNLYRKGYGDIVKIFICDYYESIGAKLVPMTAYAKLIANISTKGHQVLCKLLSNFITSHRQQFLQALRFISQGDNNGYHTYVRSLNWEIYLQQIQEDSS